MKKMQVEFEKLSDPKFEKLNDKDLSKILGGISMISTCCYDLPNNGGTLCSDTNYDQEK